MKFDKSELETRELLRPYGEDFLALNFYFDAEGRAQIGALHDASTRPGASARKIGGLERVKHRAAAWVSDHGMFRRAEAVIRFQFVQVRDVFELAITVRRFLCEGPVAARLGRRTGRQANQESGNAFSGETIVNIEFFRGPRFGHFLQAGDAGIRGGRVRDERARIGRGRRNFNLRLLLDGLRRRMLRTKRPARSQEDDKEQGEKSDDKFE